MEAEGGGLGTDSQAFVLGITKGNILQEGGWSSENAKGSLKSREDTMSISVL